MQLITNSDMQTTQVGNFAFSGIRPDKLGSTEYTLVTIVTDKTGSVSSFADGLLKMKQAVIGACKKSPRSDFLMFRSVEFNQSIVEEHGFMELQAVDANAYQPPTCTGMTALFDATYNAVAATNEYAKILTNQDYSVNGIVFVVTDGDDNASARNVKQVADEVVRGVQNEWLESLNVVLIGVNAPNYQQELEAFKTKAGLTQYVDIGDVTAQKLAKLANFVSRSISSQSQSLGTGGGSQALVF